MKETDIYTVSANVIRPLMKKKENSVMLDQNIRFMQKDSGIMLREVMLQSVLEKEFAGM